MLILFYCTYSSVLRFIVRMCLNFVKLLAASFKTAVLRPCDVIAAVDIQTALSSVAHISSSVVISNPTLLYIDLLTSGIFYTRSCISP